MKGSKALLLADRKTKANSDAMRKAAKEYGLELPTTKGEKANQELLGRIRIEIAKRLESTSPDDAVECSSCLEVATLDTAFCPYCGDEGTSTEQEAAEIVKAKTTAEEPDDEEETDESDESDDESDESDEDSDETEADEPEPDADEEPAEKPAPGVGIATKAGAPAKDVGAALKVQASKLDEVLARIVQMKKNAVLLSYDIGLEVRKIRDDQLFKARGYTSFKQFAEKELPFARESALNLIHIVENHTREQYETIGYKKMRVIASVNDNALKDELIDAAKKGATTKEIKSRVAASGTQTKKAAPVIEKGERITLLGKVGARAQIVKFYQSENGELVESPGAFQTKGFVPGVYGQVEISEGVFIRIGLRTGAKNELEGLTVRFVRASDDE